MSLNRTSLVAIVALTIINLVVLAINLSGQARAKVAEMDAFALSNDRDFRGAVRQIVSACRVRERDNRISC